MSDRYNKSIFFIFVALAVLGAPTIFNACSGGDNSSGANVSGPVTGLVVTPGVKRNTLKWDEVPGVQSYDIYWELDNNVSSRVGNKNLLTDPCKINYIPGIARPFYVHQGLILEKKYRYLVYPSGRLPGCGYADIVGSGTPTSPGGCPNPDQTSCSGVCVDLASDDANCGACGNACAYNQSCSGDGRCMTADSISCLPGYPTACSNAQHPFYCVDTENDSQNCGACGNACAPGEGCYGGSCLNFDPCTTAGGAWCNGRCTDLLIDESNCGACANECDYATETCMDGVCVGSSPSCPAGQTKCGGACVDITSNTDNCGACGNVCSAAQQCVEGVCFIPPSPPPSCQGGQTLCGNSCVDTNTDFNNCGACGNSCSPNTSKKCSGGVCV